MNVHTVTIALRMRSLWTSISMRVAVAQRAGARQVTPEAYILGWTTSTRPVDEQKQAMRRNLTPMVVLGDSMSNVSHVVDTKSEDVLKTLCGVEVQTDWRARWMVHITCNGCGLVLFNEHKAIPTSYQAAWATTDRWRWFLTHRTWPVGQRQSN